MSKSYTSATLKRAAAPRSEKLRGLTTTQTTVIKSGAAPSGSGLTSVGLTPPTGFETENSPLTANGSITLKYASGYSLPTTEKQDNWDEAVTNATNAIKHDGESNAVHTIVVCTSYPATRDANTLYILVNS